MSAEPAKRKKIDIPPIPNYKVVMEDKEKDILRFLFRTAFKAADDVREDAVEIVWTWLDKDDVLYNELATRLINRGLESIGGEIGRSTRTHIFNRAEAERRQREVAAANRAFGRSLAKSVLESTYAIRGEGSVKLGDAVLEQVVKLQKQFKGNAIGNTAEYLFFSRLARVVKPGQKVREAQTEDQVELMHEKAKKEAFKRF